MGMASQQEGVLTADMGFLWIQPDGPNTELLPLGCHDMGDIAQPQGDISLRYCPDASAPGRWKVASRRKGPPGEVTSTVTTYVKKVRDYLQTYGDCGALYVHQSECGKKDVVLNYDAGSLLYDAIVTNKTKTNTAMREGSDAAEQSFDVSASPPLSEYWKLVVTALTTTEANDLTDIAICGEDLCWGACGPTSDKCDDLCATAAAGTGVTANVICSADAGNAWAATAADPFAIDEDIAFIVCFAIDRNTIRRLVGRGTTDAGNPAEIAYSDDAGATWTLVNVGTTNGEYFIGGGSGWAYSQRYIWTVTDGGLIYFSDDGGVTWTQQVTANAVALNYVHFADHRNGIVVGDTNVIYSTVDSGAHWTAETGPAAQAAADILCCRVLDRYRWWLGYDDGEVWFTNDAGATWTQRLIPAPAGAATVDEVKDMDFYNHYHGCLAVDWTDGSSNNRGAIYRTFNGGFDWEVYPIADTFDLDGTPGLRSIIMCDENTIYAVGDLVSAVGSIYTAQPS